MIESGEKTNKHTFCAENKKITPFFFKYNFLVLNPLKINDTNTFQSCLR